MGDDDILNHFPGKVTQIFLGGNRGYYLPLPGQVHPFCNSHHGIGEVWQFQPI